MLRILHHASQVIGEAARDQEDREDLEEIGQRRRVLVRVGGVGVGVPAPVGPEHLDRHLRGHRPLHDGLRLHDLFFRDRIPLPVLDRLPLGVLFGASTVIGSTSRARFIRLEVLDHPLGNQEDRVEETQGEEQVQGRPDQVHQEVPHRFGGVPGDPPHERRGHGDAGGGGDEIVEGEGDHLGEVRHRRLPPVALPVRVRRETDRRVEGEVLAHGTEALRVERQQVLQAQEGIGEEEPHQAEHQQGNGVPLPVLLGTRVDPHQPVEEPLDGFQDGIEERLPLRVQDPVQIHAHRPGDQQEKAQEKRKLHPSVEIHGEASSLEFLGSDDRDEQVPDQQDADDADDDLQHGLTSFPGSARTGRTARTSR